MENKPKKHRIGGQNPLYKTLSRCLNCRNIISGITKECKAFEYIPSDIWNGDVEHDKPYPGDNGIIQDMMTEEEIKIRREAIRNKYHTIYFT